MLACAEMAALWWVAIFLVMHDCLLGNVLGWIFISAKVLAAITTILSLILRPVFAWQLFKSRYQFDNFHGHNAWQQALARFCWELPQLMLGYIIAQWRNILGRIDRVETLGGVTFAIEQGRGDGLIRGVSLGCFVNIWLTDSLGRDFQYEAKYSSGQIFMHEYGHTIDSRRFGWLYLIIIGLPSLVSVKLAGIGNHEHKNLYAERWANQHAQKYFGVPIKDLAPPQTHKISVLS